MSNNPIYPPLSVTMSNHYQAINIEEKKDYKLELAKQREYDCHLRLAKLKEEREGNERNKTFCERNEQLFQIVLCVTVLIIVVLFAIYIISILLGTFVIVGNYVFENTMVAMFGRAIYNKNFPICSDDIYQGADCYTRTSTYCN